MDYAFNRADFSHRTQIFTSSGEYQIPLGTTHLQIICVGAGGGGGGGRTAAAGNVRGGGGGGGAGAITPRTYPRYMLPDSLIIYCGIGGAGGGAGVAGSNGQGTYVDMPVTGMYTLSPNTRILTASGGTGGGLGSATAGAGGNGGVSQASVAQWVTGSLGLGTSFVGSNGTAGGTGGASAGVAITFGTISSVVMGGTGGGGCDAANSPSAGGALTGAGPMPAFAGAAASTNGFHSYFSLSPLLIGPGMGGGGSATTAGSGGNGVYGCGGGGGGGGVTGGSGGRGGDGFVIITAW